MEVDIHRERFFVLEEWDAFAGSGNITTIYLNLSDKTLLICHQNKFKIPNFAPNTVKTAQQICFSVNILRMRWHVKVFHDSLHGKQSSASSRQPSQSVTHENTKKTVTWSQASRSHSLCWGRVGGKRKGVGVNSKEVCLGRKTKFFQESEILPGFGNFEIIWGCIPKIYVLGFR